MKLSTVPPDSINREGTCSPKEVDYPMHGFLWYYAIDNKGVLVLAPTYTKLVTSPYPLPFWGGKSSEARAKTEKK